MREMELEWANTIDDKQAVYSQEIQQLLGRLLRDLTGIFGLEVIKNTLAELQGSSSRRHHSIQLAANSETEICESETRVQFS